MIILLELGTIYQWYLQKNSVIGSGQSVRPISTIQNNNTDTEKIRSIDITIGILYLNSFSGLVLYLEGIWGITT